MSKHKKTAQITSTKSTARFLMHFMVACTITTLAIIMLNKKSAIITQFSKYSVPKRSSQSSGLQYADPYTTIKDLVEGNKGKTLLIDMRSPHDYKARHFKNTVNVYFPYQSDREGEQAFVEAVEKHAPQFKKIILLPYSSASTTGEDAAHLLIEAGADNVWVMKIGWNELYSLPGMWIPEDQADKFTPPNILDN
jgi:rhodanese-related sulfurtransferase